MQNDKEYFRIFVEIAKSIDNDFDCLISEILNKLKKISDKYKV